MRVSLVSALAQHLNVEETEAADTLKEIVSQIREGVAREGRVDVPEVGTFTASNGDIEFTPAAALLRTINADLEGLSPVVLPPRVVSAPQPAPEEEAPGAEAGIARPAPDLEQAVATDLEQAPGPEPDAGPAPDLEAEPAADLEEAVAAGLEEAPGPELQARPLSDLEAAPAADLEEAASQPEPGTAPEPEAGESAPEPMAEEETPEPVPERFAWESAGTDLEPPEVEEQDWPDLDFESAPVLTETPVAEVLQPGDELREDLYDEYAEAEPAEDDVDGEFISVEDASWPASPAPELEEGVRKEDESAPIAFVPEETAEADPSTYEIPEPEALADKHRETELKSSEHAEEIPPAYKHPHAEFAAASASALEPASEGPITSGPAAHPEREDRPPERHARPREVIEKKKPQRERRPMWPMLILGGIIIALVAAVAYVTLLRPQGPSIVALDEDLRSEEEDSRSRQPINEFDGDEGPTDGEQAGESEEADAGSSTPQAVSPPVATREEPVPDESTPSESTPPATTTTGATEVDPARGGWTVVVGSELTQEEAHEVARTFRQRGHNAVVLHGAINGVSRYRIVVNQFSSEREAADFLRSSPSGFPSDAWLTPVRSNLEVVPQP